MDSANDVCTKPDPFKDVMCLAVSTLQQISYSVAPPSAVRPVCVESQKPDRFAGFYSDSAVILTRDG